MRKNPLLLDLRVAEHALLTSLYETLIENGIEVGEAQRTVNGATEAWSLRILPR